MKLSPWLYLSTCVGVTIGIVVSSVLFTETGELSTKLYYTIIGIFSVAANDWWQHRGDNK